MVRNMYRGDYIHSYTSACPSPNATFDPPPFNLSGCSPNISAFDVSQPRFVLTKQFAVDIYRGDKTLRDYYAQSKGPRMVTHQFVVDISITNKKPSLASYDVPAYAWA